MPADVRDDNDCYSQLKAGNDGAFRYLIRIYGPVLCQYADKLIMNSAAAEDIVTDVFVKLWEKRDSFETFLHVKKFFYTAVRNACMNYKRDKEREQRKYKTFMETNDASFITDEIIYAELLADVQKAIDGLPGKMRLIFILSYIEQLGNKEIAQQLHLSDQTVRNQKTKALAVIRGKLKYKPTIEIYLALLLLTH